MNCRPLVDCLVDYEIEAAICPDVYVYQYGDFLML